MDSHFEKLKTKTITEKDPLILLGIWNIMPLKAWRWFDTNATEKLYKLTGVKIRAFTYVKDELHYQSIFKNELNKLQKELERTNDEQGLIAYVNRIYDNFYQKVPLVEKYVDKIEKQNFDSLSNNELINIIKKITRLWTEITMQLWFAVYLDILYPGPNDQKAVKQIAAKARDYGGYLDQRSFIRERELYAEAAKRLKIYKDDIFYLFPYEIIDAFTNVDIYKAEIQERKIFCVTATIEGKYQIFTGNKAKALFKLHKPPAIGNTAKQILQGIPASNGKVNGVVRIIKKDIDFKKFKEGEILVAMQTMVHYLPLFKKAKAILTEIGGLTSHASVVSRELKKPCIVGIKNLLSSVSDADYVEVDATRGQVRILKKSQK